jgi:hypothetical protein
LYQDKGEKLKNDLFNVGFKGIKIWEQSINIMFRTGEDFLLKVGN